VVHGPAAGLTNRPSESDRYGKGNFIPPQETAQRVNRSIVRVMRLGEAFPEKMFRSVTEALPNGNRTFTVRC
jgi:hypothetical protein